MRKLFVILLIGSLSLVSSPTYADGPPAANVTCSLSDSGVRYGVSMVFTGGGISFSSLRYEWDYLVAEGGKNPTQVSSYGTRTAHTITVANGLDLSYETLLSLAKNDANASVLFYANSVFSDGISTLTNKTGSGCYVQLADVLKNKNEKAAAAQRAAADKAAADAAAVIQAAQEKNKIELLLIDIRIKNAEADELIAKYSAMSPSMRANVTKMALSRPKIPATVDESFSYQNAVDLNSQMDRFIVNLNSFIKTMMKNMSVTVTCTKGKSTKKVSGINPKCPSGYKKK